MKISKLLLTALFTVTVASKGIAAEKISVLIIDGYSNHDWRYTTEVIYSLLSSTGRFDIDISTAPVNDDPDYHTWKPRFRDYDVVVQNSNSLGNKNSWPGDVKKAFETYMEEGGGLYVYHSANNAFPEWDEYNRMIGLGWRKSDEGVAVEIVDGEIRTIPAGEGRGTYHGPRLNIAVEKYTDHPINRDFPGKWISPDTELYKYARGPAEEMQVLSITLDSATGRYWPVEWVVEYGRGRIYNSTFGHIWHDVRMPRSVQCVGFQTTMIRALQWLAGSDVDYELPSVFPTGKNYLLRPFELVQDRDLGWRDLYNGKTLDGWVVECVPEDRAKEYWHAKEGYIECNSMGDKNHDYVWLATEKEYDDFHLRLKFQVFRESKGNSGVQFRSRYDDSGDAPRGGWLNGPQVDIHGPNAFRTGLIYDETDKVKRWIHPSLPDWRIDIDQAPKPARSTSLVYGDSEPDAWNSMEIICEGMQVTTFVNGIRITSFNAEGILNDMAHQEAAVGSAGHFALQLHSSDELKIRFKDIKLKKLH